MKAGLGVSMALLSLLLVNGTTDASVSNDQVQSQHIREADGTSGQNTNSGAGVKSGHIQDSAVTSAKIQDGQVQNSDLGTSAVTTDKILDGTVGNADLAGGAVTDAKISGLISASKISSAGLNADTVDGKHASEFAPAAHVHAQAEIAGLADTLADKSDVTHDHDLLYQKKYGKVAIVALNGGDYVDPVTAMSNSALWCGTSSSTNPCLLKIMPGVYNFGAAILYMKEYIDIEGSGENVTVITSSVNGWFNATVVGANNAEMRLLTVMNTGTGPEIVQAIHNNGTAPRLTNITCVVESSAEVGGIVTNGVPPAVSVMTNVTVNVSGGSYVYGIYNQGGRYLLNNVSVTASSTAASGEVHGIENYYSSSIRMINVSVTASGQGVSYAVRNGTVAANEIFNSIFTASGTGVNAGISNEDVPFLLLSNVTATAKLGATNYGMWSASSDVQVDRSTFEGASSSIYGDAYGTLRIGSTKLVGMVGSDGTIACVGSYNASYTALNAACQ